MLLRTFQHLQGIGAARERALWAAGIRSWPDLLTGADDAPGLASYSATELRWMRAEISRDGEAWARRDASWFAGRFKRSLRWRALGAFGAGLGYVDLEADGPDPRTARITVATVASARAGIQVFCRGYNLDDLPRALVDLDGLITFGGEAFDVPLLQRTFHAVELPALVVDLRWLCRRVGYRGGLKAIEDSLGLKRPGRIAALNGKSAIALWAAHRRGEDPDALVQLITYNGFDTIHLRQVTDCCLARLVAAEVPDPDTGDEMSPDAIPGAQEWGEARAKTLLRTRFESKSKTT